MSKILTVGENKQFLRYHKKKIPNTIHRIKKKGASLMMKKMCHSNCDFDNKLKHFLSILHRKKMISPNNKFVFRNSTKKKYFCVGQTKNSPIYYHL